MTMAYYMTQVEVLGHVRKAGNSLALVIPAIEARKANLKEGDLVRAQVMVEVPEPFGLLRGIAKGRFERRKEAMWRDRV